MKPVYVLSGDDSYSRSKRVRKLSSRLSSDGWQVRRTNTTSPGGALSDALSLLSSTQFFSSGKSLLIVDVPNPGSSTKKDGVLSSLEDVLRSHVKNPVDGVVVLINVHGATRATGFLSVLLKELGAGEHMVFSLPASYKLPEFARKFCVQEAQDEYGCYMSDDVAETITNMAGNDLWFLSQEVKKLCLLARSGGRSEVSLKDLSGTLSQMDSLPIDPLVDAMRSPSLKAALRQLRVIRKTHSGDPTIWVCHCLVAEMSKWLEVAVLAEAGTPAGQAAGQLGMNPWYHDNIVLPAARRWGSARILSFMRTLSSIERGVLRGESSPWTALEVEITEACESVTRPASVVGL